MRPMVLVFLAGLVLAVVVGLVVSDLSQVPAGATDPSALPPRPPTFSLIDHHGRPVSERDYRGSPTLVYFGYTWCPDVCPTELDLVARALEGLGADAARTNALFISVDPGRDTPEVLASYVANFHPRLTGLTGSATAIAAAAENFLAVYQRVDKAQDDRYDFVHSSRTVLLDANGKAVASFPYQSPPERMTAAVQALLR